MNIYLTHAQVILPDEVLADAALRLEDGRIRAINPAASGSATEIDLQGQFLMPGMIDLHGDALEKDVEPRPNVFFPLDFAIAQADKRNAQAGISTGFHALSFAHEEFGVRNVHLAADLARAVQAYQSYGLVDNRVHCRYEITDDTGVPVLLKLLEEGVAQLLSFMDHTPGQGQFKELSAYRDYLARTYAKLPGETQALLQRKLENAHGAYQRIDTLVQQAHQHHVHVASHDDDGPEWIGIMTRFGVRMSEFPTDLETSQAARAHGLWTIFGAPNLLRGKSQSGAMRALDALCAGVADCLCSDYAPASLLTAVFRLPELAGLNLPEAIRLVTINPARAAGLDDRGEIAPGKRADLIAVRHINGLPHVTAHWVNGERTYRIMPPGGVTPLG